MATARITYICEDSNHVDLEIETSCGRQIFPMNIDEVFGGGPIDATGKGAFGGRLSKAR